MSLFSCLRVSMSHIRSRCRGESVKARNPLDDRLIPESISIPSLVGFDLVEDQFEVPLKGGRLTAVERAGAATLLVDECVVCT